MQVAPDMSAPIMQKLIGIDELFKIFTDPVTAVSGYCHQLAHVLDVPTPSTLVEALGVVNPAEYIFDNGSLNLLRWPGVGSDLYRIPLGGKNAIECAAVEGWVVEEEPFVGLGFAPNPNSTIVEYKVSGLELPYGAEVWEFDREGQEHHRATYSADAKNWFLVRRLSDLPQDDTPPGPPRMRAPRVISSDVDGDSS